MKALGVTLRFTDRALETLADQGFDPDYGARPLRRTIRAQVEDVAAEQLLSGALQPGTRHWWTARKMACVLYAQPAGTQALNHKGERTMKCSAHSPAAAPGPAGRVRYVQPASALTAEERTQLYQTAIESARDAEMNEAIGILTDAGDDMADVILSCWGSPPPT